MLLIFLSGLLTYLDIQCSVVVLIVRCKAGDLYDVNNESHSYFNGFLKAV